MPFDYQSIRSQAGLMAEWEQGHQKSKQKLSDEAFAVFQKYSGNLADLKDLVEKARSSNANLRCAVPTGESLDFSCPPDGLPEAVVLVAADGSQVFPDRNDPVDFGLVNVGSIRYELNSSRAPVEQRSSTLLYGEALHDPQGYPAGEDILGLQRDYQEREYLAWMVEQEELPVVALTDGPLEFHREPRSSDEYQKYLDRYLGILHRLAEKETAAAGYVDRPRSDLVIRLLELAYSGLENLAAAGRARPFISLSDADLFSEILAPGRRSAVFAIQSPSTQCFAGDLALHFFYLNVGRRDHPDLARVEIPAWVVNNPDILRTIHAVLVDQCRQMGTKPYPYILHRAHEIALVRHFDKAELIQIISDEFQRRGIPVGTVSNKQHHKNLGGSRTRVKL